MNETGKNREFWNALIPAAIGLWSAANQSKAAKRAAKQTNRANSDALKIAQQGLDMDKRLFDQRFGVTEDLLNAVNRRDFRAEADEAGALAGETAARAIRKAIKGVNADFARAGVNPNQVSEYRVRTDAAQRGVTDPLRQYIAQLQLDAPNRKMNATLTALNAQPGKVGDSYYKAATFNQPKVSAAPQDYSSQASVLAQLLSRIGFGGGSTPPGRNFDYGPNPNIV